MDGIFDGLVNYMESINLPKKKRQKFLRFFWHAKSYLRVQQIETKEGFGMQQILPSKRTREEDFQGEAINVRILVRY